mgnify:CR=1 FL=1
MKKKNSINLISLDDKYSRRIFYSKKINNKISFSIKNINADFYYKKGLIIDNYFHKYKKIKLSNISLDLSNTYNIQNIIVAYIVSKCLKIPNKLFNESIKNFKGLPYRSSVIYNSKKKLIINNSKATNIISALSTLEDKKNIYLILGGIAKEQGFNKFCKYRKDIKKIYIYGSSRFIINKEINLNNISKIFNNLEDLVNKLWKDLYLTKDKVTIIYAPACSSYDQFQNFEKRGDYFNQLIFNKIRK